MDPREPDPVYVTLREAARKRSDTGRGQLKKQRNNFLHHRRRCYSENGMNTNKLANGTYSLVGCCEAWRFQFAMNYTKVCPNMSWISLEKFWP